MKTFIFFGALAAMPAVICAFSTYYDSYDESNGLALRSLEARFADKASQIAYPVVRRAPEDDGGDIEGILIARVRPYHVVQTEYFEATKHFKSLPPRPSVQYRAALNCRNLAQEALDGRQHMFNQTNDNDPNHLAAINFWRRGVEYWQGIYETLIRRYNQEIAASRGKNGGGSDG